MLKFKKFVPFLNRVLIEKATPVPKSKGGILLSEKDAITNYGKVIAVGPGDLKDGKRIPTTVQVGQNVLLPDYGGTEIALEDDKKYFVYRDEDILGILSNE